jgi:protein-disulfide isomerase
MRRSLPFLIIGAVLIVALGAGVMLFRYRMEPEPAPPPPPAPTPAPTAIELPSPSVSPTATEAPSPTVSIPEITSPSPDVSPTAEPSATPTATSIPKATKPAKSIVFRYGQPGAEPQHVRGDPNAPVVLEEFGDFECMPCSVVSPVLEKIEQEFPEQLVVVFREHPLRMHHYAPDAARAAEAAGLQGKFWEMHDTLYRNRATWVPAPYVGPYLNDYAAQLGLDVDRFKADMDGAEVTRRLAADWDRGDSLGIDRTPIIYVNGEKILPTEHNEKGLRERIQKALAAKTH